MRLKLLGFRLNPLKFVQISYNPMKNGSNISVSFEFVEKTRETKAVSASGRRANEFYLSKIQALEKVLVEMRKKKRKRKGQQSQECRFVFFRAIDRRRQHF